MTTHDPESALAWDVEQYLQGELPAGERAALERDPLLPARVAALQTSNEAILELHPPAAFAAAVRAAAREGEARAIRTRSLGRPRLLAVASLGAAARAAPTRSPIASRASASSRRVGSRRTTRSAGATPPMCDTRSAKRSASATA